MPTTTPVSVTVDLSFFLWIFFGLVIVMTIYFVFAHLYHWIRYAGLYPLVWVAIPIYLGGIFVFISIMLGAIALT